MTVTAQSQPSDKPRVGGWGFAIFFFGLIGGLIGWLSLKERDRRRADHVLKWGLIVTAISIACWVILWLVILAAIAHSAKSLSSYEPTFTDTSYQVTNPTPTGPTPDLGESQNEEQVTLTTSDGYSASATIDIYKPFHADQIPALPYSSRAAISACTVNAQTDAVVPIAFSITNTTASFNETLGLRLVLKSDPFNGISSDASFTSGPSCTSSAYGSDLYGVSFNDPATPNATDRADLFLVVPGYYSPSYPDGNIDQLSQTMIAPLIKINDSPLGTITPEDPSMQLAITAIPGVTTTETTASAAGGGSGSQQPSDATTPVSGNDFDLSAPASWNIVASEEAHGDLSKDGYYETSLASPDDPRVLVKVDESPGDGSIAPQSGAETVEGYLVRQPGYRRLGWKQTTYDSHPAFRWEFVDREHGVLMHKVDLFIQDETGDYGLAILIQAPAASWNAHKAELNRIAASLAVY